MIIEVRIAGVCCIGPETVFTKTVSKADPIEDLFHIDEPLPRSRRAENPKMQPGLFDVDEEN